jgi:dihydrofolate synthase / folylpolyglutamate synthase
MDTPTALHWLNARQACSSPFGLHRIEFLLERLGHPQRDFVSVLIGGTNGKGSVTALVESILTATDEYLVGTLISPHLVSIEERIHLQGKPLEKEWWGKGVEAMQDAVKIMDREPTLGAPSFFELVTALAFWAFRENDRDLAIVEVGLGGRLDATNILSPEISVITNIGTDHQELLGPDRPAIAREKLGIIRKNRPLITGERDPDILDLFAATCATAKVPLLQVEPGQYFTLIESHPRGHRVRLREHSETVVEFPLAGAHQLENLATALAVVAQLRTNQFVIPVESVIEGIAKVSWPGRLQWIDGTPPIVLDGAHNQEGLRSLLGYLEKFPLPRPCHIILGTLQNKPSAEMARLLAPHADTLAFVPPPCPRALDEAAFTAAVHSADHRWQWAPDLDTALARGRDAQSILITGSLYLIADFLAHHAPPAGVRK